MATHVADGLSSSPVLAPARALERGIDGGPAGPLLDLASRVWGRLAARSVVRKLAVPPWVRVVAVGGATLGGSGKTPVAIACARELARHGMSVAFVGHAYRAKPGAPRVVRLRDRLQDVGDEALVACRELAPFGVPVVVAPARGPALSLAAGIAHVLVLDGVGQLAPTRADLSILAVDAGHPWGTAGLLPPRGDLRAPLETLLGACDVVVTVGDCGVGAKVISRGAWRGETLLTWDSMRGLRLGLVTAVARPERIVAGLRSRGLVLNALVHAPDHGPFGRRALARVLREPLDLWLCTRKCALHLPSAVRPSMGVLDYRVELSVAVAQKLTQSVSPAALTA